MKVTHTKKLSDRHSIEVGNSTWDDSYTSVRNRYKTEKGGFSPRSSSEIPIDDIKEIVSVVAEKDLLSSVALAEMCKELTASLERVLKKGE